MLNEVAPGFTTPCIVVGLGTAQNRFGVEALPYAITVVEAAFLF